MRQPRTSNEAHPARLGLLARGIAAAYIRGPEVPDVCLIGACQLVTCWVHYRRPVSPTRRPSQTETRQQTKPTRARAASRAIKPGAGPPRGQSCHPTGGEPAELALRWMLDGLVFVAFSASSLCFLPLRFFLGLSSVLFLDD